MIDYAGALNYFKADNHPRASIWIGFGESQQKASIAAARRLLSRALGRALSDTESAYVEGDETREEYAVYEQALWMLENGIIANGEQSAPAFIAADPEKPDNARDSQKKLFAPETLRWLGANRSSVILIQG